MKIVVVDGPNDSWWTKFKRRAGAVKDEVKYRMKKFVNDHPSESAAIGCAIVGGAGYLVKEMIRYHRLDKQEDVKRRYIYDPSMGHYWELRRPLRTDEAIELDRRHQMGERYGDILQSMKILK